MQKSRFGVRKVSEDILIDNRALIVTGDDNDWDRIPDGAIKVDADNGDLFIKHPGESHWIPYGLSHESLKIARDPLYISELFTVTDIDMNNGEFKYEALDYGVVTSTIENGKFIFNLTKGSYVKDRNRIYVIKNDYAHLRQDLGNLEELDERRFVLEGVGLGDVLYVNYVQIVEVNSPFPRVFIDESEDGPPVAEYGDIWIQPEEKDYYIYDESNHSKQARDLKEYKEQHGIS